MRILQNILILIIAISCQQRKNQEYISVRKGYYPSGELETETFLIDESRDYHKVIQYYENGNKMKEGHVESGLLTDTVYYYYPNGELNIKSFYVDGKVHGTDTFFNKKGLVTQVQVYEMGKKHYTEFYSDCGCANSRDYYNYDTEVDSSVSFLTEEEEYFIYELDGTQAFDIESKEIGKFYKNKPFKWVIELQKHQFDKQYALFAQTKGEPKFLDSRITPNDGYNHIDTIPIINNRVVYEGVFLDTGLHVIEMHIIDITLDSSKCGIKGGALKTEVLANQQ